ncbi:LPXTG cell wall anchor domain-containing protein [Rhizocola hellebori]|uniref:LPXTG cell wall anchor domain-containing protein n=1 Tax=Rhizocola hellebori TaxID=1392758 RepID=UPI0019426C21|nr:LPXTG cell wall anchor domain-containing protein [Rhizocola hellebori]
MSIINDGPGAATGIKLTFDTSQLAPAMVWLELPAWCDTATKTCEFTEGVQLTTGENLDTVFFRLLKTGGSTGGATTGPAGKLKVTVSSDATDPNASNNVAVVDVMLSETDGVDLKVLNWDVAADITEDGDIVPVKPGETAPFIAAFYNQGTAAAKGVVTTVMLPAGATFEGAVPHCVYSEGNRKAVCTEPDWIIPTGGSHKDDSTWYGIEPLTVRVASTVAGPVNLTPGNITIEPMGELEPESATARSATAKKFTGASARLVDKYKDIDPTDNGDDFIVYVGSNGNLPQTGTNVALIAGIGGIMLIAGGTLFMITRRRRVVA